MPLLPGELDREFAVADALGQAFGVTRGGLLPIGGDELAEGGEQANLRHAVAVDTRQARLGPGLLHEIERCFLLLMVRQETARWQIRHCCHCAVMPSPRADGASP